MSIGRLFVEIGGNTKPLNEALQNAVQMAEKAGLDVTNAGKKFLTAFDAAVNPTTKYIEKLVLLDDAGKSATAITAKFGEELRRAITVAEAAGQPVSDVVRHFAAVGDEGKKTGISVEALGQSIMDFAANPMASAKSAITSFLGQLGPTAVGLAGIATGVGALGGALFSFISDAADAQEELDNLSTTTGLTVNELQALKQIASEAGMESLDLGRMIGRLNQELGRPEVGEFEKALRELGISIYDNNGKTKDAITLLDELKVELEKSGDASEFAQKANAALGGRLQDLIPLMMKLDGRIRDNIDSTARWVGTSERAQESLRKFDSLLDQFGLGWQAAKVKAIEAIMGIYDAMRMAFNPVQYAAELQIKKNAAALEEYFNKKKEATTATNAYAKEEAALGETLRKLKADQDAAADAKKRTEDASRKAAEAAKKAAEEAEKEAKELERLLEQVGYLDPAMRAATEAQLEWAASAAEARIAAYRMSLVLTDDVVEAANEATEAIAGLKPRDDMDEEFEIELSKLPPMFEDTGKKVTTAFAQAVSTIGTDLSKSIVDGIMSGEFKITDTIKKIGESLLRALVETLVNPFIKLFQDALGNLLGGIFGSATGAAGSAAGSAVGSLGESLKTAFGSMTGMLGNVVSGAISGLTAGIIGLFKNDHSKEIEQNTRYTSIDVHTMIDLMHGERDVLWLVRDSVHEIGQMLNDSIYQVGGEIVGAVSGLDFISLGNSGTAIAGGDRAIRSYATGGYVDRTGLALVHAGETVVPPGAGNITVNIYGDNYGMDDLDRKLAASVSRVMERGGLNRIARAY